MADVKKLAVVEFVGIAQCITLGIAFAALNNLWQQSAQGNIMAAATKQHTPEFVRGKPEMHGNLWKLDIAHKGKLVAEVFDETKSGCLVVGEFFINTANCVPAMLQACENALATLDGSGHSCVNDLRAAIALAKGEK